MIKVESFSNQLLTELSCELEDFINDNEIEDIITLDFYSGNAEDGRLWHYAVIVYKSLSDDELIGGVQEI